MRIDLRKAQFTQAEVAACTSASVKTVDNYIQHEHVTPSRKGGRRMFTALQMIEIDVVASLAELFKIPPSSGTAIAEFLMKERMTHSLLRSDAGDVGGTAWSRSAAHRTQVTVRRTAGGAAAIVYDGRADPSSVDLVFPVQLVAREVLRKAVGVLKAREAAPALGRELVS